MPHPPTVLPTPPRVFLREVPLEAHDTSYLADSVRIFSFCITCSFISLLFSDLKVERVADMCNASVRFLVKNVHNVCKTEQRCPISDTSENCFYVVNQLFIVLAWMLHSENADIM